jgi:hypothetical protein
MSRAETLMTTYNSLTPAERAEFRAMLAGYAMRDKPAQAVRAPAKKKSAAAKPEEA